MIREEKAILAQDRAAKYHEEYMKEYAFYIFTGDNFYRLKALVAKHYATLHYADARELMGIK